ncbi:MAG: hypothetical protein CMH91_03790 [Oceanicaulis sp.]|jgi:predicted histidine transporter YuiF (NhaC family)|uniref:hypothetical protein n=1 Tax=unclassified Oceanicaulis TaxID=2632123 RepID=UPI000066A1E9|nr:MULTISPECIES: hypothetical protein [unclassified Oceanicaulis]EAP89791.1 5'-methylthioadenosine phosphorylase [Oceanicaulis sp. HTCC2633]MBC38173.1 hypothetical protein [Oceanicaulis sp.]
MSFQEKSNLVMTVIIALAYGAYFAMVMPPALNEGPSMEQVGPYLFAAVVFLVIGGVVGHILVAMAAPKESDQADERDKLIEMRADARSSYVLGTAAILALGLALTEQNVFWIVHMILGGLVVSELVKGVLRAIDYRMGV